MDYPLFSAIGIKYMRHVFSTYILSQLIDAFASIIFNLNVAKALFLNLNKKM